MNSTPITSRLLEQMRAGGQRATAYVINNAPQNAREWRVIYARLEARRFLLQNCSFIATL